MKTLGEILKNARLDQNLTLEQVSRSTRIEEKYLRALEENHYHLLPAPTFTKGFIRNYAKLLDREPDELIAIYRRDFHSSAAPSSPASSKASLARPLLPFSKSSIILGAVGLFVFFSYLAFQYRALLIPPPLTIIQPEENAVTTSPITLEGRTSSDSLITLNQETDLSPNQSGAFLTQINLSPGQHRLEVTATNRFGRTASKTLTITILSSN